MDQMMNTITDLHKLLNAISTSVCPRGVYLLSATLDYFGF